MFKLPSMLRILFIAACLSAPLAAVAQVSILKDASPDYVEKLVATARANYPKFKWAAAKAEYARIGVSKAKLSWFDFLQLSYGYTPNFVRQEGASTYYSPSQIGIFMNIGNILQKPAVVKQAKQEYTVARLDMEVTDLNLETMVRTRYYLYLKQLNILQLRVGMVSDASDQLKGLRFKFENGQIPFDSYNQAQLAYSRQVEEKISAEADMLIARSSLEELLGAKLEDIN